MQPSGGGSRETDYDEGAALEHSGRVKEPEEATESIGTHAPVAFATSCVHVDRFGVSSQFENRYGTDTLLDILDDANHHKT